MNEHKEPIPSMIYNASIGGHVTSSQQIIDENENKEQSQINVEVKQIIGQGESVDNRISKAKNDIINNASSNGNTLKKLEDRVLPIESAVGTGGNIDSRIEVAVNVEKTRAEEAEGDLYKKIDTLETIVGPGDNVNSRISNAVTKETARAQNVESTLQTNIDTEIVRAQTAEEQLRTLYNNLQQSNPIPVTELPDRGEEGKIYRLVGTTSYSDYMWNGTQFIKMATYNNAIDNDPIIESENLVKSGGVFTAIEAEKNRAEAAENDLQQQFTKLELKTATTSVDVFWTNVVKAETSGSVDDAVLNNDGSERFGINDFKISPFIDIVKNQSYYYIPQSIDANFANICYYDKNKVVIGVILSSVLKSGQRYKLIIPTNAKYIRCTYLDDNNYIYTTAWTNDLRDFEEFNGYQIEKRGDILLKNLVAIETTFENGIFEKPLDGFYTSDYIEISNKPIYAYLADVFSSLFKLIEFYNYAKKPIFAIKGGIDIKRQIVKLIPPLGTRYVRYAKQVGQTSFGLFYFNGANLESQVSEVLIGVDKSLYTPLPNIVQKNIVAIETTFENGIFERLVDGFYTSDYIELDLLGKSYVWINKQDFSSSFHKIEYYDKDKNLIAFIPGNVKTKGIPVLLNPPKLAQYVRFATSGENNELYIAHAQSFESAVKDVMNTTFSDNNHILWIGTSIPRGSTYPKNASERCGYNCINKSLGASQLRFTNIHPIDIKEWSGRCLTARVAELEALYRADVSNGTISESQLDEWKNYSFERSILPYIDGTNDVQISMLVFDHGFNDRNSIHELLQNENEIDWESRDRSNFVGAFNFLMDEIFSRNPFLKVVVAGYFQNKFKPYYSADICKMQRLISEHYGMTLLPAWEHTQITDLYIPNSSDYIEKFNAKYGTSYTKRDPDSNGNIMSLQLYCPDEVHPHSDLTGNCNKRLDAVYSKLLRDVL